MTDTPIKIYFGFFSVGCVCTYTCACVCCFLFTFALFFLTLVVQSSIHPLYNHHVSDFILRTEITVVNQQWHSSVFWVFLEKLENKQVIKNYGKDWRKEAGKMAAVIANAVKPLSDQHYKDVISSATNIMSASVLCAEHSVCLPLLDSQHRVAKRNCYLWMGKRH